LDGSLETEEEKREKELEKRLQEGIGVPHIVISCPDSSKTPFIRAVETGKLPSVEQVVYFLSAYVFRR